jgi:hypothetical protein
LEEKEGEEFDDNGRKKDNENLEINIQFYKNERGFPQIQLNRYKLQSYS